MCQVVISGIKLTTTVRRRQKSKGEKVDRMMTTTTMTMGQTMRMKVVCNWHRIMATQCVIVVEKKVTVNQIVQ